ncbi:hypothetical protein ECP03047993_5711 [Escherichia coli P0304799.3]|nr:hypothetical protein ECP03047993_5711 [Escherichia coli P0304799.3]
MSNNCNSVHLFTGSDANAVTNSHNEYINNEKVNSVKMF